MLVAAALLAWPNSVRARSHPAGFKDIIIITGKGRRSDPMKGPILKKQVRKFLYDHGGPKATDVEGNDGCFLVTGESFEEWFNSKHFWCFKYTILRPLWIRQVLKFVKIAGSTLSVLVGTHFFSIKAFKLWKS